MFYDYRDFNRYSCALARMQTYLTKNADQLNSTLLARAYNLFGKLAQTYYKPEHDPKINNDNRPSYVNVNLTPQDCRKLPEWSMYSQPKHYTFEICLTAPDYTCGSHHIVFESGYDQNGYDIVWARDIGHFKRDVTTYSVRAIIRHLTEYIFVARTYLNRKYAEYHAKVAHEMARRKKASADIHKRAHTIQSRPYSLEKLFGKQALAKIDSHLG